MAAKIGAHAYPICPGYAHGPPPIKRAPIGMPPFRSAHRKTGFTKAGSIVSLTPYHASLSDRLIVAPPCLCLTDGWAACGLASFLFSYHPFFLPTFSLSCHAGQCSPVDCFADNKLRLSTVTCDRAAIAHHYQSTFSLSSGLSCLSCIAHPPAQVFFVPLRDGYFSFSYPDRWFAPVGQNGFSPNVPFRAPSLHPISGCHWPLNGLRQAHGAGLRHGLQSCAFFHPTSSVFKVGKCHRIGFGVKWG